MNSPGNKLNFLFLIHSATNLASFFGRSFPTHPSPQNNVGGLLISFFFFLVPRFQYMQSNIVLGEGEGRSKKKRKLSMLPG